MCGPSTLASGPVGQHQEVKADERQQWTAGLITDNVSGLHNTKNTIPQLLLCCLRGKRATRISCRFPRIHYIKPHNSCLITPDQTPGFITGSVLICARRATSILYKCITTASDVSSEKITTREQGRIRIETSTTKKTESTVSNMPFLTETEPFSSILLQADHVPMSFVFPRKASFSTWKANGVHSSQRKGDT